MSLLQKLKNNSKINAASVLEESIFLNERDEVQTPIPALNIALSGKIDGGLQSGILQIAGPSKHFKTSIALIIIASYLQKYQDAVLAFYDSEFGSPLSYFKQYNIDTKRVLHIPVTNIEQLKFDLVNQLENLQRDEKVIFLIDSIGNLASKKELEDAINEKAVADMTRAKQLKSLFRMITPHLTIKNIPLIVVNHVYQEIGTLYPKMIVSGGTGGYYSSNDIWIVGRQQEKEGNDLAGYTFIINIEKSRRVKEKAKIPLTVTYDGGVYRWSGLLDLAIEAGIVVKSAAGWYQKADHKFRARDVENDVAFWETILNDAAFQSFVKQKYQLVVDQLEEESDANTDN